MRRTLPWTSRKQASGERLRQILHCLCCVVGRVRIVVVICCCDLIEEAQLGTGSLCSTVMLFYMDRKQTGHLRVCVSMFACMCARVCACKHTRAKQAGGASSLIDFMSFRWAAARRLDLG